MKLILTLAILSVASICQAQGSNGGMGKVVAK